MVILGGKMSLLCMAVITVLLSACQASANEDCLWYVDKNGTWHNGFDCPLISFCCGSCHRRYCCLDAFRMITEREQRGCTFFRFSPTTIAGIASSILLFVVVIATVVCCFLCSCCYLYERRHHHAQQIPMTSYPVEPVFDAYGKPLVLGQPEYPAPAYYPGLPQPYPMMHPGAYPPYPLAADPGYNQGEPPPYSPPQYTSH